MPILILFIHWNNDADQSDILALWIVIYCSFFLQEVASVAKGDEDFSNALKDPLYDRIRKALYSDSLPDDNGALELQDLKEETHASLDEGARDSNGASGLQKDFKKDACLGVDRYHDLRLGKAAVGLLPRSRTSSLG